MSAPLAGCTIVVTRPAAQAGPFIDLASRAGAHCVAFPTLEIEALPLDAATRGEVARTDWDWAVYTSTNAVEVACDAFGHALSRRVAAIGRATARALARHGVTVDLRPATSNSEGLLAMSELQQVTGLRVLLVKGAGGRDLLRETLTARGALVRPFDVYRRVPARPTAEAVSALGATLRRTDTRLVVAVTSAEVLDALLQLCGMSVAAELRRVPLLLPGPRVAAAARSAGWTGAIVQATTAEDEAMVHALVTATAGGAPDA